MSDDRVPSSPTPRPAPEPSDAPSAWEDELRAGQREAGESGSLAPELAIVGLLRYAGAPPSLDAAEVEAGWHALDRAFDARASVARRRRWVVASIGLAATLAAVVVLRVGRAPDPDEDPTRAMRATWEAQFALLAEAATQRRIETVEARRAGLRRERVAALSAVAGGIP